MGAPTRVWVTITLAWVLMALGCGATSDFMKPAQSSSIQRPAAGKALVWIARPSRVGSSMTFTLMDERGRFLGEALPGTRFAVLMDPGEHMLIVWSEGQQAMKATLAPGKTYYVHVTPKIGMWKAGAAIYPVKRNTERWNQKELWKRLQVLAVDAAKGQAHFESMREEVDAAVKGGMEAFEGYSAEEKAAATMGPEHGE